MNEQRSADALAAWLAAGGATPPPDLDPEVAAAVFALRPDLAPAPRVRADDILASVMAGPLARAAAPSEAVPPPLEAAVLPFPVRAPRPAPEALPVAVVEVVDDDEADGAGDGEPVDLMPIDAEVEAWESDPHHAADVIELEGRRFGRSRALAIGSVGLAAAAAAALFVAGGGSPSAPERTTVAAAPTAAPAPEPAAIDELIPEVPLEEKPKATAADAKALAAAARSATAAVDALLAGLPGGPPPEAAVAAATPAADGDAVAVADEADAAAANAPTGAVSGAEVGTGGLGFPGGGSNVGSGLSALGLEGSGYGGGGAVTRGAAPVAAAPPPSSKVIAEAEAPAQAKEEAKKAPSPAALAKARSLESQIVAPAASGQKVAAQAAQAALDGGDPAYALVLIKKGLALGGEGTPERARLDALKATVTQRLKGL
jgi:hypothetical protein